MGKKLDLTGKRFGRLTVIEETTKRYFNSIVWKCKCSCGNEIFVPASRLKNQTTKSCGCLHRDITQELSKNDLTGKRFGRLTVIKDSGKRTSNRNVIWICKCDCGKTISVVGNSLTSGNTQSCGCLQIETNKNNNEKYITNQFRINFVENTALDQLTKKVSKNNKSGTKGVCWRRKTGKWRARIGIFGKDIYLGEFENLEDAVNARKRAEEKYFHPILEKYGREIPS